MSGSKRRPQLLRTTTLGAAPRLRCPVQLGMPDHMFPDTGTQVVTQLPLLHLPGFQRLPAPAVLIHQPRIQEEAGAAWRLPRQATASATHTTPRSAARRQHQMSKRMTSNFIDMCTHTSPCKLQCHPWLTGKTPPGNVVATWQPQPSRAMQ